MRIFLTLVLAFFITSFSIGQAVFINEVNFDDPIISNRGVELAGPSGLTLTGWKLKLYLNDGSIYYTQDLDAVTFQPAANNIDLVWFPIAQLRSIDENAGGIALVNGGLDLLQFISYGGLVTATEGEAIGLTSEQIGLGHPLLPNQNFQLSGFGLDLTSFAWLPNLESPGLINLDQVFGINLPLELKSFLSTVNGSNINVEWTTLNEERLASFQLEHSMDGISFETEYVTEARNEADGTNIYTYQHRNLAAGAHYYRLISTENDGSQAIIGKTIVEKIDRNEEITVSPNPASEQIIVNLSKGKDVADMEIYDIAGKLVQRRTVTHGQSISIANLVPGKYILMLNDGSSNKAITFLKTF